MKARNSFWIKLETQLITPTASEVYSMELTSPLIKTVGWVLQIVVEVVKPGDSVYKNQFKM